MTKPKALFIGMPRADSSFYEMNIAQLPQGPRILLVEKILKALKLSSSLKRKIRLFTKLENIFNPKRKTPYMGMRLLVQNLKHCFDIKLVEYPKSKRWILKYLDSHRDLSFIGISIGCENRTYHARDLAQSIKKRHPNMPIIFGNYGASAAKIMGVITPAMGTVLWDSQEERQEKKRLGKDFYKGEGVHDIRLWLRDELGIDAGHPNTPLVSEAVSDAGSATVSKFSLLFKSAMGFLTMPKDSHKLVSAIGCSNNCDFCNSSKIFNKEKTFLYEKARDILAPMEQVYEKNLKTDHYPPEANFFIMDENFMKDEMVKSTDGKINFVDIVEELCDYIEGAEKNIHFGTFSDIRSLLSFKRKNGDFRKLVRGGITSIWIGIESREDVFGKRGDATPEMVQEIVSELQSLGIIVIGSFIADLSYHTEGESVHNTGKRSAPENPDGIDASGSNVPTHTYEALNIWEDAKWWRSLETGARQVMMHSITGVVGRHDYMFRFSDYEFGHRAIPGHNPSVIGGKRLEEIDERLRELFYEENGPVALSSLLVMWSGFMNLKDSENKAELRSAIFCYWMVMRNLDRISLITFLFTSPIFTKCSDHFLRRVARMFKETELHAPPNVPLHEEYKKVFAFYESKNGAIAKSLARRNRRRFIEKYL